MAFHVELEPQGCEVRDQTDEWIKASSSFVTAEKWLNGMIDAISNLREMLVRLYLTPEAE
jgi:hypothetical protein